MVGMRGHERPGGTADTATATVAVGPHEYALAQRGHVQAPGNNRGAGFRRAAVAGNAWFDKVAFGGDAWFGEAAFTGGADTVHFERARILSPGASHMWPTGWRPADVDGGRHAVLRANHDGGA